MATEALQQAQAEKLTLLVAESKTGYFGVTLKPGLSKPYQAQVWRGGNQVHLGYFETAEEAALCVARSPEGRAAAAERAAAAAPLTSEEARQQAQAEKLTLLVAENSSGYFGVCHHKPGQPKPYQAHVRHGGKHVYLGYFATAEEAALCVARSPEGRAAAAERAAAAVPLTIEEARQQAQAEKLTLLVAENKAGYFGVHLDKPGQPKPYKAQVSRGGRTVHLGYFATAEEAALCVARTPEGQAAAGRAAAAGSQGALPAVPSGVSLKEEGTVPPMPPGAFVKEEGGVPPMPPDAFVKVEVVVKEEEGSTDGRPKRRRTK
jgi:predicted secreted protein